MEPEDHQRFLDIVQMSKSSPWVEFREMVTGWMAQAYDKMIEAEHANDSVLAGYTRAYIQRMRLKREIEHWVNSAEKGLEEITEAMRQDLERMSGTPEELETR